jgi:predicted oxidoreductase
VDGHQVTIEGIRRSGNEESASAARLWCVPPSTTNSTVMEVVVAWVNQHPNDYESIMGQFNGINAATAVIVKAMVTSVDFHKSKC